MFDELGRVFDGHDRRHRPVPAPTAAKREPIASTSQLLPQPRTVLQRVALCCNVSRCAATCRAVLQRVALCCKPKPEHLSQRSATAHRTPQTNWIGRRESDAGAAPRPARPLRPPSRSVVCARARSLRFALFCSRALGRYHCRTLSWFSLSLTSFEAGYASSERWPSARGPTSVRPSIMPTMPRSARIAATPAWSTLFAMRSATSASSVFPSKMCGPARQSRRSQRRCGTAPAQMRRGRAPVQRARQGAASWPHLRMRAPCLGGAKVV